MHRRQGPHHRIPGRSPASCIRQVVGAARQRSTFPRPGDEALDLRTGYPELPGDGSRLHACVVSGPDHLRHSLRERGAVRRLLYPVVFASFLARYLASPMCRPTRPIGKRRTPPAVPAPYRGVTAAPGGQFAHERDGWISQVDVLGISARAPLGVLPERDASKGPSGFPLLGGTLTRLASARRRRQGEAQVGQQLRRGRIERRVAIDFHARPVVHLFAALRHPGPTARRSARHPRQ